MFTYEEKRNRWTLFDLLPLDKQRHIHNLILRSAQQVCPSTKAIVLPVRKTANLHLVRAK